MRSTPLAALACLTVLSAILTGCASASPAATGGPSGVLSPAAPAPATAATAPAKPSPPAPTGTPAPAVKSVPPGNCSLYTQPDAVKLLGGVTMNNKLLAIQTAGGTPIDQCSYIDLKSYTDIQGVTYAVVRYDSPATAFAKAQQVQAEMLDSATEHSWDVQPLGAAVPGAGKMLGGYGTKTDSGVTYTIAVVGTNVGPYLVAALGASSDSPDNAKTFAQAVFKNLASSVG